MRSSLLLGVAMLAMACGSKSSGNGNSLCSEQVPPPEACSQTCDVGSTTCPAGYHCSSQGKCDAACTPGGDECGSGQYCTEDGYCMEGTPGPGSGMIDANCPAVHFTAKPTTPSIQLLIDRSSSMNENFTNQEPPAAGPYKFPTVKDALVGAQGVVSQLEASVNFGATLYTTDGNTCPSLQSTARGKMQKAAIKTLLDNNPPRPRSPNPGFTPTPKAIDAAVADFLANPPPADSPKVIVLATDGLPNQCGSTDSSAAESVTAAANAFSKGIKLYILAVSLGGSGAAQHIQDMANAGQGVKPGQPNAKPYVATSPAELATAFQQIIGGVTSCDLKLSGKVDAVDGQGGVVVLHSTPLKYGTDWTLDADGVTIHLLANACNTLKTSPNPTVDASFDCGAVIF